MLPKPGAVCFAGNRAESMNRLLNIVAATLLVLAAGCTTPQKNTTQHSSQTATCQVCLYNNDLACVNIRLKDTTPRAVYRGTTYCFCSEDCREAFLKKPDKFLPKARKP